MDNMAWVKHREALRWGCSMLRMELLLQDAGKMLKEFVLKE